jgi:hypothetical protein
MVAIVMWQKGFFIPKLKQKINNILTLKKK